MSAAVDPHLHLPHQRHRPKLNPRSDLDLFALHGTYDLLPSSATMTAPAASVSSLDGSPPAPASSHLIVVDEDGTAHDPDYCARKQQRYSSVALGHPTGLSHSHLHTAGASSAAAPSWRPKSSGVRRGSLLSQRSDFLPLSRSSSISSSSDTSDDEDAAEADDERWTYSVESSPRTGTVGLGLSSNASQLSSSSPPPSSRQSSFNVPVFGPPDADRRRTAGSLASRPSSSSSVLASSTTDKPRRWSNPRDVLASFAHAHHNPNAITSFGSTSSLASSDRKGKGKEASLPLDEARTDDAVGTRSRPGSRLGRRLVERKRRTMTVSSSTSITDAEASMRDLKFAAAVAKGNMGTPLSSPPLPDFADPYTGFFDNWGPPASEAGTDASEPSPLEHVRSAPASVLNLQRTDTYPSSTPHQHSRLPHFHLRKRGITHPRDKSSSPLRATSPGAAAAQEEKEKEAGLYVGGKKIELISSSHRRPFDGRTAPPAAFEWEEDWGGKEGMLARSFSGAKIGRMATGTGTGTTRDAKSRLHSPSRRSVASTTEPSGTALDSDDHMGGEEEGARRWCPTRSLSFSRRPSSMESAHQHQHERQHQHQQQPRDGQGRSGSGPQAGMAPLETILSTTESGGEASRDAAARKANERAHGGDGANRKDASPLTSLFSHLHPHQAHQQHQDRDRLEGASSDVGSLMSTLYTAHAPAPLTSSASTHSWRTSSSSSSQKRSRLKRKMRNGLQSWALGVRFGMLNARRVLSVQAQHQHKHQQQQPQQQREQWMMWEREEKGTRSLAV